MTRELQDKMFEEAGDLRVTEIECLIVDLKDDLIYYEGLLESALYGFKKHAMENIESALEDEDEFGDKVSLRDKAFYLLDNLEPGLEDIKEHAGDVRRIEYTISRLEEIKAAKG